MKTDSEKRDISARNVSEKKILIIDSDSAVIALLRNYLEGEKGFSVVATESGSDGVRMAAEHAPALILLDFRLFDMNGLEVHERLRAEPLTGEIPIVYISSFLPLRSIEKASTMGARGFLRKPFTPAEIYFKIASVLEHA